MREYVTQGKKREGEKERKKERKKEGMKEKRRKERNERIREGERKAGQGRRSPSAARVGQSWPEIGSPSNMWGCKCS